jgi:hypothetical protein
MTGRLLEALRMVPPALWRHLGAQFEIDAPDLASLRTMYRRRRTLFEQQDLACSVLGFHDVTEAQRRALVRAINAELSRTSDRQRLLQFARRWLYDHKQIIPRERELRGYIAKAIRQHEATLVSEIVEAIDPDLLAQWRKTITQPREDGATVQSWLWAAPAKHSTRQIDRVLERIELLTYGGIPMRDFAAPAISTGSDLHIRIVYKGRGSLALTAAALASTFAV